MGNNAAHVNFNPLYPVQHELPQLFIKQVQVNNIIKVDIALESVIPDRQTRL